MNDELRLALDRDYVRQFPCCDCQARRGDRCVRVNGRPRERNHRSRVKLAIASDTRAVHQRLSGRRV